MRRIAHISDLHFGTEIPEVTTALYRDLTDHIPDLLIVSGDITQRGRRREFHRAEEFIQSIPCPRVVIPGNHDISLFNPYRRFFKTHRRFNQHISEHMYPRYIDNEIAVFGLNTTSMLKWKAGIISRKDLAYIEDICCSVKSRHKAIVTHHPFVVDRGQRSRIVGRALYAMRAIEKAGIDIIFTGHLHSTSFYDAQHFFTEVDKTVIISQAGTAISSRSRKEPNTYNLITVDEKSLEIRAKIYINGQFTATDAIYYEKENGTWNCTTPDHCLL